MTQYPPWMAEVFASNMAYRPKSRPNFPADLHHDIRDHMLATRAETLSMWTGWAADRYLAAARLLDLRDDPVADSLQTFNTFDLRTLWLAHDYMAAHWRYRWLPDHLSAKKRMPDLPGAAVFLMHGCLTNCMAVFRNWLWTGIADDSPRAIKVIRGICLVLVQQNTSAGIVAEMDLFDTLREHYPVPPLAP